MCLLVLALFLMTPALQAQGTSFGLRAGINSATVDISDGSGLTVEPDSRIGIDIAAVLNLGITDAFSVQPELHFIQKGYMFEFDFFGDKVEQDVTLNYVEVPILAKYAFGSETFMGFVEAGPSVGFGLNGNVKTSDGQMEEEEDINFGSEEDELKALDIGVAFGAGVGVPVGPGQLFLDVRYQLGLSNISNEEGTEATEFKNKGLSAGLGFLFPIGQ